MYATDSAGNLIKYPGPPISLVPKPYLGGDLRYSTDGSAAYRASLADLVRTAKITLLFAESSAGNTWNFSDFQAQVERYEAGNAVECRLLPLLNIQSGATEEGSAYLDMNTSKFVDSLLSSSATWGANMALLVRWVQGRVQEKALPPLPTVVDDSDLTMDPRRITVWPGPNAPC